MISGCICCLQACGPKTGGLISGGGMGGAFNGGSLRYKNKHSLFQQTHTLLIGNV